MAHTSPTVFTRARAAVSLFAVIPAVIGRSRLAEGDLLYGSLWFALAGIFFTLVSPREDLLGEEDLGPSVPDELEIRALPLITGALALLAGTGLFSLDRWLSVAWVLFIGGVIALWFAVLDRSARRWERPIPVMPLLLLMVVAYTLRVVFLSDWPPGLWFDEANVGLRGQKILADPSIRRIFFGEGLEQPALHFMIVAGSMKLLGSTIFALRHPTVIIGALTIPLFWLLLRAVFRRSSLAWVGAVLLLFAPWHLNFSRWSANAPFSLFCDLGVFYLLWSAAERHSLARFLRAGLLMGAGLHFYHASRIFSVFAAFAYLVLFLHSRHKSLMLKGGLLFGLSTFLVVLPLLLFALQHPEVFSKHTNELSVFGSVPPNEVLPTLLDNARLHFLMYTFRGDAMARHTMPEATVLPYWTGLFFVLGLSLCIVKVWKKVSLLILGGLVITLLGGILSKPIDLPTSLRTIDSSIFVYALSAYGIQALVSQSRLLVPGASARYVSMALLSLITLFCSFEGARQFYRHMHHPVAWGEFNGALRGIAEELNRHDPESTRVFLSSTFINQPTLLFLAPQFRPAPYRGEMLPFVDSSRDTVVCLRAHEGDRRVERFYPGAEKHEITPWFEPRYVGATCYLLRQKLIEESKGVALTWHSDTQGLSDSGGARQLPEFKVEGLLPPPGAHSLRLRSVLKVPATSDMTFRLNANGPSKLYVNEREIAPANEERTLRLPLGLALIESVSAIEASEPVDVSLLAKTLHGSVDEEEALSSVDPNTLFRSPPLTANGLLARYYSGLLWDGAPKVERVDAEIDFYFHNHVVPQPNSITWEGLIEVPKDGSYTFEVRAVNYALLYIDDALILRDVDPRVMPVTSAGVSLTKGKHQFVMAYASYTGYAECRLLWSGGSAFEVIPYHSFTPAELTVDLAKLRRDADWHGQ